MGLKYGMHLLPFGALKAKGGEAMKRIVTFPTLVKDLGLLEKPQFSYLVNKNLFHIYLMFCLYGA